ncbi:MAG: AcrR family transcriptional regulator [bacterium]|jgi:AcrR family transcriptional regulator
MKDTKRKILDTARIIYLREGIEGISMRKIAKDVGISATAIYRHFKNKEVLLAELIVQGFRFFEQYLFRALEKDSAADRLVLTGQAYCNFALEQSQYYNVIFSSAYEMKMLSLTESMQKQVRATFQFIVDRVRDAMEEGFLIQDDSVDVARTLWVHAHGMVSLHLAGSFQEDLDFKAFFNRSMQRLLLGIQKK